MTKWPNVSLRTAWSCEQELMDLDRELGGPRRVKSSWVPTQSPVTQAVERVEFYMKEAEGRPMADAVKELVELPRVKEAIHRLLKSEITSDVEAALRTLGPILSALSRLSGRPKEDAKAPVLDDSLD